MMNKLLRKIRGLVGIGLNWGVLWGAVGAGIGTVIGILNPEVWQWSNPILEWGLGIGAYGFVSGIGFGTLLTLREGRKTLADLSLRRVAKWGVLGAAAVPLLFMGMFEVGTTALDVIGAIVLTGSLGGTFAPISVAIARRSELKAAREADRIIAESDMEAIEGSV